MSNIDDIFKKGLDGKGMEYSDASWSAMEQVLTGTKLGFFARYKLLLGLGSLLLIGSITLLCLVNNESNVTANTPVVVNENIISNNAIEKSETSVYDDPVKVADYETTKDPVYKESWTYSDKEKEISTTRVDAVSTPWFSSSRTNQADKHLGLDKNSGLLLAANSNGSPNSGPIKGIKDAATIDGSVPQPSKNNKGTHSRPTLGVNPMQLYNNTLANAGSVVNYEPKSAVDALSRSADGIAYDLTARSSPNSIEYLSGPHQKKVSLYIRPYAGYVNYAKNIVLPEVESDRDNNLGKSTAQSSYNYGVDLGVKRGNWMLSTGLGVLSLREKTYYTESMSDYEYITALRISNTEFRTTPRGTRVALISEQNVDSTLVETVRQICEGCEASFNYVSVPLSVQYNLGKGRLRYFAEAGVTASFLQNAKGNYAFSQLTQVDTLVVNTTTIVSLDNSSEVANVLLQANAAVGVKFWLSPRWNVWSSYGYGLGLNSMLGNYEHIPSIQNLRVGVEFKLR
jgi:hypothetical protein